MRDASATKAVRRTSASERRAPALADQEPLEEEEEESILDEVFGAITRAARELRKMSLG